MKKPSLKERFKKVSAKKAAFYIGGLIRSYLLFPFFNSASRMLGIFITTTVIHHAGAYLLPTLQDVQDDLNLDNDAIEYLDPYLDVRVQTDSLYSKIHEKTSFPGLAGIATQYITDKNSAAYAYRGHSFFIDDDHARKLNVPCIINIPDQYRNRLKNKEKSKGLDDVYFDKQRSLIIDTWTIFHEIRHCSKNQPAINAHEMEASYHASKALSLQFNSNIENIYNSHFSLGTNFKDVFKNESYNDTSHMDKEHVLNVTAEYDYYIYKDYAERGIEPPHEAALIHANKEAYDVLRNLLDNRTSITVEKLKEQWKKSEKDRRNILDSYAHLSPLTQRRLAHYFQQARFQATNIYAYDMSEFDYLFTAGQKTFPTPRLKPQKR